MLEIALLVVLVAFVVSASYTLRAAGPVAHWVAGWAAAGIGGFLIFVAPAWPRLALVTHGLGTLYAALLLSGTLLLAGRRLPPWLLPGAIVYGTLRTLLADRFGNDVGYAAGLVCEPIAVAVAAKVAFDGGRRADATAAERWLGPAFVVLAGTGVFHLGWLASGRSPSALAPLLVVVAPLVLGVQIQAAADRLRTRIRAELEARVAERTTALVASEERFRAISDVATDFAFKIRIDRELRLTREWVHGAFAKTLGREPAEIDGRGWIELVDPAERDAALAQLRERGTRPGPLVVRLRRRDGSHCVVEIQLGTFEFDAGGTAHVLGSGRDVTALAHAEAERERLARHVEQVARLESLGILAGGIAHDFNNLLTVIRGSARLALADLAPDAAARPRVERVATAAEHAAALTEEMLAYAGKSETSLAPLDPTALVRAMEDLLRASVAPGCALVFELDPDVPAVLADANGLRRVLLNLVLNASDALDGPGRVVVRSGVVDVSQSELDEAFGDGSLAPGRYVALDVHDAGCGMDAATAQRVFEPFFTTKFSGRGLGMAAVLGIVHAHHGVIRVVSAPGEGTLVRVLLPPTTAGAPAAAARAVSATRTGATTGAAVLVVDDDEGVLELAREVLAAAGHRVAVATGGREAVERVEADPRGVDVLVLDVTMPDLGGEQVFEAVRALRPDLPVILVTGYDSAQVAKRFAGLTGFLRKPWEPEELVAAVELAARAKGAASLPA